MSGRTGSALEIVCRPHPRAVPVPLHVSRSRGRHASSHAVLRSQAGWENDITTGFDWYINSQVHFIVNYVYTHLDYVNGTSGNINGLGCRLHLDF